MRKNIALLLVLAMLLSVLPVTVFAVDGDETRTVNFTLGGTGITVASVEYSIESDAEPQEATGESPSYTISKDATGVSFTLDTTSASPALDENHAVKVMAKIGDDGEAAELTAEDGSYSLDNLSGEGNIAVTVTIEVIKKTLTADLFTFDTDQSEKTYTGSNLAASFKAAITVDESVTEANITYKFKKTGTPDTPDESITEAGTYDMLACISGDDMYENNEGVKIATVTVNPKTITAGDITLKDGEGDNISDPLSWTGLLQNVSVTVNDGTDLTEGTDYTVTGALSGSAIGDYTVTVTGKGNYAGEVEKTWSIAPVSLTGATVTIPKQTYTGSVLSPNVTVTLSDGATILSTDKYEVSDPAEGEDYVHAGNKTVTVTAVAGSGYDGEATGTFIIDPAPNPAKVTTSAKCKAGTPFDLEGLVQGAPDNAVVTFKKQGESDAIGTPNAYTPSAQGTEKIDVEIAAIDLNDDDNPEYETLTATITITVLASDADLQPVTITVDDETTYNGNAVPVSYDAIDGVAANAVTITFTGTKPDGTPYDDNITTTGTDENTATLTPTDAGTWTVTVEATKDSTTYYGSKAFTIKPADLADADVEITGVLEGETVFSKSYTGTELDFTPNTVEFTESNLTLGSSDYEVSGEKNTAVGSYQMTITPASTNQNYTGSKTVDYKIVGKTLAIASATAATRDYDGTNNVVITAVTFDPDDSLTLGTDYSAVGTLDENGAAGTRNISVTVTMVNQNYRLSQTTKDNAGTVEITKANLSSAEISEIPTQRYTGSAVKVDDFTVTLGGRTLEKVTDYTVGYNSSADAADCIEIGTVTVTITGTGNYEGSTSTTYDIAEIPLARTITVSPTSVTVTAGSSAAVTINDNAKDDVVTYDLSGNDESIATVAVGGDTITVYGEAAGTTTVTLEAPATNRYDALAAPITIAVKVNAAPSTSTDSSTNTGSGSTNTGSSSGGGGGGGGGGSSGKPGTIKPAQPQTPNAPTSPTDPTPPTPGVAGFYDVAPGAWYADAVEYVVDRGLFSGVSDGNFAPETNMTRAMMWTVLARYMGANTNSSSGIWYAAAQAWAIEKGISDGTMADGNVSREQFVTMLWRLSGEPAAPNSASFTDGGSVSDYARAAVDWAVAQGIVNGYNDGSFRPQGSATRAEVAKMLTVFCSNAENAPAETAPETTVPDDEK